MPVTFSGASKHVNTKIISLSLRADFTFIYTLSQKKKNLFKGNHPIAFVPFFSPEIAPTTFSYTFYFKHVL